MKRFLELDGLRGFGYYNVKNNVILTIENREDFFKNSILANEEWNGRPISQCLESVSSPLFDSGVICAKTKDFRFDDDEVSSLKCFVAPYQLMSATIADLCKSLDKKSRNRAHKYTSAKELKASDGIAVAVGMVLSIVATAGSAEKDNRTPYIVLIRRRHTAIRGDELDPAVVEGLNYGDFFYKNDNFIYQAKLDDIAKRAIEEERGINCDILEKRGLLHMPERYYLGYDEEYHQWNFFGTVVIDCTVEEIIKEGCYFTKDKFESKGIIGMPIDPNVLFYYLSFDRMPILDKYGCEYFEKREMWNTTWASILFAVKDFCVEEWFISREICFLLRNHSWIKKFWYCIRKGFNNLVKKLMRQERGINILSALLSIILMVITILYIRYTNALGVSVTILSSFIAFVTCCYVVILARGKNVFRTDFLSCGSYSDESEKDEEKRWTYQSIQETAVFRNVCLIDGSISEQKRKVTFSVEESELDGNIKVSRNCRVFIDDKKSDKCWTLIVEDDPRRVVEHNNWRIITNKHCEKKVRIVIPCISKEQYIVLKDEMGKLKHLIDLEIPYKDFIGMDDEQVRSGIIEEVKKIINEPSICNDIKIDFRFILESEEQKVIVGFTSMSKYHGTEKEYVLSHDLSNSTFADKMIDDITRVACEYATSEFIGYRMSER